MTKKFLRRIWNRYSKLGKRRKKKQKWRRPKGRDNKMREKRKGYPKVVSVGYKKSKRKKEIVVRNIKELKKGMKNVVLGRMGKKKKIEIAKKARELGINIVNIKIDKLLSEERKLESKKKENKEEKK